MIITDEIKRLRELEAKATPGPWDNIKASPEWYANGENNYNLCRAARNALPQLLDALEQAIDELKHYATGYVSENFQGRRARMFFKKWNKQ